MNNLLVIGERRSGTTFLANLLNSQKGITIVPNIFVEFLRPFDEKDWAKKKHSLNFNEKLSTSDKKKYVEEIKKTLKQFDKGRTINFKLRPEEFNNLKDLYSHCISKIPRSENHIFIGHKVDRPLINNVSKLLKEFPIKVIYVYRDPRDVVLSARIKWPHNSTIKTINKWNNSINDILKINDKNLFIIKHEDLIQKNETTLSKLNKFLNINLDTSLTQLKNYSKPWDAKNHSSHNDVVSPFDTNAIYRWKKNPKKKIFQMCSRLAEKNMDRLGYDKSEKISIIDKEIYYINDYLFVQISKLKRFYQSKIRIKSRLYKYYVKLK